MANNNTDKNSTNKSNDDYVTKTQLNAKQDVITTDKFSDLFCETLKKSKDMDKSIKDCLQELITKDVDIKNSIQNEIDTHDKGKRKAFKSKLWNIILTLSLSFITALFTVWASKFFS